METSEHKPRDRSATVIVVHNGIRYLEEQLTSMADELKAGDLIVCIDDYSDDGSERAVRGFADELGVNYRSRLSFSTSKLTVARIASNFDLGCRIAARSGYKNILMSDQDDVWVRGRVSRHVQRLRETGAMMTCGQVVSLKSDVEESEQHSVGKPLFRHGLKDWSVSTPYEQFEATLRLPSVTGAACAVTDELVDLASPIPTGWLHDRWYALVAAAVGKLDHDPRPVLRYRLHDRQTVGESPRAGLSGVPLALVEVRKLISTRLALRALAEPDLRDLLSTRAIVRRRLVRDA
ncbi:glycosyltransferase [Gordonia polyisoprenivorans]|nr:glycosyltransferase [Gordonia polyisoprenivorans]